MIDRVSIGTPTSTCERRSSSCLRTSTANGQLGAHVVFQRPRNSNHDHQKGFVKLLRLASVHVRRKTKAVDGSEEADMRALVWRERQLTSSVVATKE